jgi:hypothetical protein
MHIGSRFLRRVFLAMLRKWSAGSCSGQDLWSVRLMTANSQSPAFVVHMSNLSTSSACDEQTHRLTYLRRLFLTSAMVVLFIGSCQVSLADCDVRLACELLIATFNSCLCFEVLLDLMRMQMSTTISVITGSLWISKSFSCAILKLIKESKSLLSTDGG